MRSHCFIEPAVHMATGLSVGGVLGKRCYTNGGLRPTGKLGPNDKDEGHPD